MKTDRIALLLTCLALAVLWIEHRNRTEIELPLAAEYRPCPDSDAVPYNARCIEFMMGTRSQNEGPVVSN